MHFWRSLHPVRTGVIEALSYLEAPISPVVMQRLFAEGERPLLTVVSYHMRTLADPLGLIEVVKEVPVRGSVEHFYYWCAK